MNNPIAGSPDPAQQAAFAEQQADARKKIVSPSQQEARRKAAKLTHAATNLMPQPTPDPMPAPPPTAKSSHPLVNALKPGDIQHFHQQRLVAEAVEDPSKDLSGLTAANKKWVAHLRKQGLSTQDAWTALAGKIHGKGFAQPGRDWGAVGTALTSPAGPSTMDAAMTSLGLPGTGGRRTRAEWQEQEFGPASKPLGRLGRTAEKATDIGTQVVQLLGGGEVTGVKAALEGAAEHPGLIGNLARRLLGLGKRGIEEGEEAAGKAAGRVKPPPAAPKKSAGQMAKEAQVRGRVKDSSRPSGGPKPTKKLLKDMGHDEPPSTARRSTGPKKTPSGGTKKPTPPGLKDLLKKVKGAKPKSTVGEKMPWEGKPSEAKVTKSATEQAKDIVDRQLQAEDRRAAQRGESLKDQPEGSRGPAREQRSVNRQIREAKQADPTRRQDAQDAAAQRKYSKTLPANKRAAFNKKTWDQKNKIVDKWKKTQSDAG